MSAVLPIEENGYGPLPVSTAIDAYILKPLTTADLAARVMKVIEKANTPPAHDPSPEAGAGFRRAGRPRPGH